MTIPLIVSSSEYLLHDLGELRTENLPASFIKNLVKHYILKGHKSSFKHVKPGLVCKGEHRRCLQFTYANWINLLFAKMYWLKETKNNRTSEEAEKVITFVFTEQHSIASEWSQSCFKMASLAWDSTRKSSPPVWILKHTKVSSWQWKSWTNKSFTIKGYCNNPSMKMQPKEKLIRNRRYKIWKIIQYQPVAPANPSCQSKSLRWTRKGFGPHLGAKPGRGNSHGNPLNRPYNTTNILASHGSHIVPQVVLKSKLESNSQDWSKVVTVQISLTSWTSTTSSYFKRRGQIQCPSCSCSWPILHYKYHRTRSCKCNFDNDLEILKKLNNFPKLRQTYKQVLKWHQRRYELPKPLTFYSHKISIF